MRVYAICTTNECDPGQAHLSLEVLRLFCHGNNLVWGRRLCVAGAAAVAAFARTERMGRKRRGCSEAIDRLIGAVARGTQHRGRRPPFWLHGPPCALQHHQRALRASRLGIQADVRTLYPRLGGAIRIAPNKQRRRP